MRRMALMSAVFASCAIAASASSVQIEEIGLRGFFSDSNPARVKVAITNTDQTSQQFELRFHSVDTVRDVQVRDDQFSIQVSLAPGEQRSIEIPLLLSGGERPLLRVELRDISGRVVAHDSVLLKPALEQHSAGLIAILCVERTVCDDLQSAAQANAHGDTQSDQPRQRKVLEIVSLSEAQNHWWDYAPAGMVVLAGPVRDFTPEQRAALEGFVRRGGKLILVADRVADPSFMSAYRQDVAKENAHRVGKGLLLSFSSLSGPHLQAALTDDTPRMVSRWNPALSLGSHSDWMKRNFVTSFQFPSLAWLMALLVVYTLAVGILNFWILQKLGKREWGWLTVPAIALIFAGGFYEAAAAKRPKQVNVDEYAVYWLDDRSDLAAEMGGERVSSPHQQRLSVRVPGDWIFEGVTSLWTDSGVSMNLHGGPTKTGLNISLGPSWQAELSFAQWSFRDLEFETVRRFPGTVVRSGPKRLRNDTGQNFQEALYVEKENAFLLGPVRAGAEVDLDKAREVSLKSLLSQSTFRTAAKKEDRSNGDRLTSLLVEGGLLTLVIRPNGDRSAGPEGTFLGLADEPVLQSAVGPVPVARQSHALTIVHFAPQP